LSVDPSILWLLIKTLLLVINFIWLVPVKNGERRAPCSLLPLLLSELLVNPFNLLSHCIKILQESVSPLSLNFSKLLLRILNFLAHLLDYCLVLRQLASVALFLSSCLH
jgi:hypothetical protein